MTTIVVYREFDEFGVNTRTSFSATSEKVNMEQALKNFDISYINNGSFAIARADKVFEGVMSENFFVIGQEINEVIYFRLENISSIHELKNLSCLINDFINDFEEKEL